MLCFGKFCLLPLFGAMAQMWLIGNFVQLNNVLNSESNSFYNRVCRFRNLCYHPDHSEWFIVKTNSTIQNNVPRSRDEGLLESGTVETHPFFFWDYVEVSPFIPSMKNVPVRYEEKLHFISKRLHPRNIMHNLHDDVIGMYFMLTEFVGQGNETTQDPFSLDTHRIMIIDQYGETDSTRPFHYLSDYPLRFEDYVTNNDSIITCFRDAVVGNTKLTTWYQYGFREPQGPIANKYVNGLHIREVAQWFIRRIGLPLSSEEDYTARPGTLLHRKKSGEGAGLDFADTDIIVILARKGNRLILNEDQLSKDLTEAFGLKAVYVRNEDHSFEEQISFLRRARVVLAMHGSILVMTIFCRRGTVVVEMFPFAVPSKDYTPYKSLAELHGMNLIYRTWEVFQTLDTFKNRFESDLSPNWGV